jgi:toxin-antitoxin system PIN domain toxin
MRTLFDVNVLIALLDPAHIHHRQAHEWWMANSDGGWATCPFTEHGFVRIVSQRSYPEAITTSEAMRLLRASAAKGDHAFWGDDISVLDQQRFVADRIVGPKQLTDIYLLGVAVKNGGRLATFDRAIPRSAVTGAEPRNLVVI